MRLRGYECSIKGSSHSRTIYHATAGKARYEYFLDVKEPYPDIRLIDIRVLSIRAPQTDDSFRRVADYRGVPFARVGMRVEVEGNRGLITGANSSANFDVLFEDGPHAGHIGNCHPQWMFKYFTDDGAVLKEFGVAV